MANTSRESIVGMREQLTTLVAQMHEKSECLKILENENTIYREENKKART